MPAPAPGRVRSLDVFRGATVALMILVNNPGSWKALYPPLAHAPWHGVTPTDLVFPFFLFAVGLSLALTAPALQAAGAAVFWRRVVQRTALIFVLGLMLNAAPFVAWGPGGELAPRSWDTLRLMGVLQRIALSFGLAALVVGLLPARHVPGVIAALLLGYWAACLAWGAPGDPYSLDGWFGTAVDRALLGAAHLYQGEGRPFDPEGLASTAPAVAQVLLGWWAGHRLVGARAEGGAVARLFLAATALLVLAWVWALVLPMNKKIWTPSYVVHTTGLAMMALAVCMHLVDIRRRPAALWGWARFFEVFGRNPLFIFVLSGLVPRVLGLLRWPNGVDGQGQPVWTTPLPWLHDTLLAGLGPDPRLGSVLFAVANLALYASLAFWLDRRRVYFRV